MKNIRNLHITQAFDIAHLRPATLPKGRRFETVNDARRRTVLDEARLRRLGQDLKKIADIMEACRDGDEVCGGPNCPLCARAFRRWFCAEALRLATPPMSILTVHIEDISCGELLNKELNTFRARVRKQLQRLLPRSAFAVGGLEVSLDDGSRVWCVHAHLLVVGAAVNERFHGERNRSKRRVTCKWQEVRDPVRQLSYLLKFATLHYPGQNLGGKRGRPYPLPDAALAELAKWRAPYKVENFVIAVGVRRRGSRFVRSDRV